MQNRASYLTKYVWLYVEAYWTV